MKSVASPQEWKSWTNACRSHRLCELLHEDPFTKRAFRKPRGYAGDAELLDYIYGVEEMWPRRIVCNWRESSITRPIHRLPRAYARARVYCEALDRVAEEQEYPHVLSLAAGHLREVLLSAAIKRRQLGRMLALDADAASMSRVAESYGCYGVETYVASIRTLFGNKLNLARFDLVYSTGLFDYLQASTSRRLVATMFNMLNPGGRVVVANFLPGVRDVGYMEVFMDWHLIFRTRHEMMEMTAEIPESQIHSIRIFAEENQNIIFLEVVRK